MSFSFWCRESNPGPCVLEILKKKKYWFQVLSLHGGRAVAVPILLPGKQLRPLATWIPCAQGRMCASSTPEKAPNRWPVKRQSVSLECHQILSAGSGHSLQGLTAGLVPAVMSRTAIFYNMVKDKRHSTVQPIAAVASNPKNRREICKSSFFRPKAP